MDYSKAIRMGKRIQTTEYLKRLSSYFREPETEKINTKYPQKWLMNKNPKQKVNVAHFDISDVII